MAFARSPPVVILLLLLHSAFILHTTHADGTISITDQPAYSRVRPCVQNCIWCGQYWLINCPGGAIGIPNAIGCQNLDSCLCRADLAGSVSSYLTTCINSQCNADATDVSAGISLYNGYCGLGGTTLDNYPATTSAAATGSGVGAGTTTTMEATPGSAATVVIVSTVMGAARATLVTSSEWPLQMALVVALATVGGAVVLLA